jgi:hypothetical protein
MTRPSGLLILLNLLLELLDLCRSDVADKRMPTDDGNCIPARYSELEDVFPNTMAEMLAAHRSIYLATDLEPGLTIPNRRIYNLSEVEFRTL